MLVMFYHSIMIQKNVLNDLGDTILKFSNFNFKLDIFINPICFLNLFLMCRNEIIDTGKTPLKYINVVFWMIILPIKSQLHFFCTCKYDTNLDKILWSYMFTWLYQYSQTFNDKFYDIVSRQMTNISETTWQVLAMVMMLALDWIARWIWFNRASLRKQHCTCRLVDLLGATHTLLLVFNTASLVLNRGTEDTNTIAMPNQGMYVYIYILLSY